MRQSHRLYILLVLNLSMEELGPPPRIPQSGEPRYCPDCGSRVADLASSCIMCGASLDVEEEAPVEEPQPPRFQIPWRGLFSSILAALAFLAVVGWLVRAQIIEPPATPTPTVTPTATPSATPPPRPTETLPPTETPTPIPPQAYPVQPGDTCVSIAAQFQVPLDLLIALNPDKCGSGGIIRPGDPVLIPAPTSTAGPAPTMGPGTPLPTQECPILYVVESGDTALGIAERLGVSLQTIQEANGLDEQELAQLRVSQVLQIPCSTPSPSPTPTRDPNASPTPLPKYAAPVLLSPADGAVVDSPLLPLQWTTVSLLRENEWYAIRLRRLDEDIPVESCYTKTTVARLGIECASTPQDGAHEYSWEVTVVRLTGRSSTGEPRYAAASHSSEKRTFRWLVPPPHTPTVTVAP
jgi:LysM repeat protein